MNDELLLKEQFSLRFSFFYLCNEATYVNPISNVVYLVFEIADGLFQLILPVYTIIDNQNLKVTHRDNLRTNKGQEALFYMGCAVQILLSVLLFTQWIYIYKSFNKLIQWKKQIISEGTNLDYNLKQKYLIQFTLGLYVFFTKLALYPILLIYFIFIKEYLNGDQNPLESTKDAYLRAIAMFFVITAFAFDSVFESFLTPPFPDPKVPWAKNPFTYPILFNFHTVLYAFTFSLPSDSTTFKIFISFCFLVQVAMLIGSIIYLRSFSIQVTRVLICKSCFYVVSSFIIMADVFIPEEDINSQGQLIAFLVSGFSLFFCCVYLQEKYSLKQTTKTSCRNYRDVIDRIGRIMVYTSIPQDNLKLMRPKQIILQSLFFNHIEKCEHEKCMCKDGETARCFIQKNNPSEQQNTLEISAIHVDYRNKMDQRIVEENKELSSFRHMQMAIIRILISVFYENSQEKKKEQVVELYFVKYQLQLIGNLFQNYFQMMIIHNCKLQQCTLMNCYWAFGLRVLTLKKIREAEKQLRAKLDLSKHLQFQQIFHKYLGTVKECTAESLDYWKYLAQESQDVRVVVEKCKLIHQKYLQFKLSYSALEQNLGQTLMVECIAFKIHKAVLNFEGESEENLNMMCILDSKDKSRFNFVSGMPDYSKFDGKLSLTVISLNPDSFQKITCVNKQFCLLSGYSEDELRGKITIIMPSKIAETHEYFMKDYIEKQNRKFAGQAIDLKTWIKHKNECISPLYIKAHPLVSLEKGLSLIGVMHIPQKVKLYEQDLPTKSVFFIITDKFDQILHFSLNCHKKLHISLSAIHNQVPIKEFFPELFMIDSWPCDTEGFETYLNLISNHVIMNENTVRSKKRFRDFLARKKLRVKIQKVNHQIGHYMFEEQLIEYKFVLINEHSESTNSDFTFDHQKIFPGGPSFIRGSIELPDTFSNNEKSRNQKLVILDGSSDEDPDEMTGSVTSASSSTRSTSNIRDIKGILNLSTMPRNLSRFKWNVVAFFSVLIMTAIALLIINLLSKGDFNNNLILSEELLTIRNRLESTKLEALYIYTIANNQKENFTQGYNQNQTFNDTLEQFSGWLNTGVTILQDALNNITSSLYQQNPSLIELIKGTYLNLHSLTSSGTLNTQNITLITALEQFIVNADTLIQSSYNHLQVDYDIYGIDLEELANKENLGDTTKSFYFIKMNSLSKLGSALEVIEAEFTTVLFAQNDSMIKGIMIVTIICSIIIFIASTIILPFMNSLDFEALQMLEMTLNISKEVKLGMLRRIKEVAQYLNDDLYLLNRTEIYNEKFYDQEGLVGQDEPEGVQKLQSLVKQEEQKAQENENEKEEERDVSEVMPKHKHMHKKKGKNLKDMKDDNKPGKIFEDESHNVDIGHDGNLKKHVTIKNSYQLKSRSLQQKLRKAGYIYLFALMICCFYTGSFFLSKTLFNEFIKSFDYSQVFYERKPCISNIFFMMQMEYFQYQILYDEESGEEIVEKALTNCYEDESEYRKLLQAKKKVFRDIQDDLERVNSNQLCDFMQEYNIHDQNCSSDLNGLYELGLEQIIQAYQRNVNQRKIDLDQRLELGPVSQAEMQLLFFEEQTFNDILSFFNHIQKVLSQLQLLSEESMLKEVQIMFNYLLLIFIAFIVLMFILVFVALKVVIRSLHNQIIQTQIGLKVIPGLEYVRLKQEISNQEDAGVKDFLKNLGKL